MALQRMLNIPHSLATVLVRPITPALAWSAGHDVCYYQDVYYYLITDTMSTKWVSMTDSAALAWVAKQAGLSYCGAISLLSVCQPDPCWHLQGGMRPAGNAVSMMDRVWRCVALRCVATWHRC